MSTTIIPSDKAQKKPSSWLLIIGVIFFILLFVPDPLKFIPFVNVGEELVEGGISLSALLIYAVRYWLYHNIKAKITLPTQNQK